MAAAPLAEEIDVILQGAVRTGAAAGAMVSLIDRTGRTLHCAAGVLNAQTSEPVEVDTPVWLASLTKAFTSVAALQLIESGKLQLDAPVRTLLPEFADLEVLEGFVDGRPKLRRPLREVTIRHLLTHTSGLGYNFANAELLRYQQSVNAPDPFSGRRSALQLPLVHDPGTHWEYGVSTDWLGLVVEQVSGERLDAYLAGRVFAPLGMDATTFTPSPSALARMMGMHQRTAQGGLQSIALPLALDAREFVSGGAGAFGTAPDYLRFLAALLGDGSIDGVRILKSETLDMALRDQAGAVQYPSGFSSSVPELANSVPPSPFAQGWGFGFHLTQQDIPTMRSAGSADWAGLPNTYFWLDRASGVACVFVTQILPGYDQRIVRTLIAIERALYAR